VPSLAEEDTPVAGVKTEEERAIDADLEMAMSNSVKNSHSAASKVRALAKESFKQVNCVLYYAVFALSPAQRLCGSVCTAA
jgi:hypothetical protein